MAQRQRFDYVVYGRVEDFRVELGRAYLRIAVDVADRTARTEVFHQEFESGDGTIFANVIPEPFPAETRRTALRLLGWLLFVILLPLGTGWFWKNFLERESNFVNVMCLLFLTAVAMTVPVETASEGFKLLVVAFAQVSLNNLYPA